MCATHRLLPAQAVRSYLYLPQIRALVSLRRNRDRPAIRKASVRLVWMHRARCRCSEGDRLEQAGLLPTLPANLMVRNHRLVSGRAHSYVVLNRPHERWLRKMMGSHGESPKPRARESRSTQCREPKARIQTVSFAILQSSDRSLTLTQMSMIASRSTTIVAMPTASTSWNATRQRSPTRS